MTPLALMDDASSSILASSIWRRGCCSFGASRSTSTSSAPGRTGSDASGISALNPLPSAGRRSSMMASFSSGSVPREHLFGQGNVGCRTAGCGVLPDAGNPMAWRFTQPDVARNDRVEHFLFEELAHIARDELPEVGAVVVHREQHAFDVERRIQRGAHAAHRPDEI